jgi:hypothetical protein
MMTRPPEPMTIAQLKAHMDRRFDRLERTKADRSELRRLAATADRRWAATTRAFSRFATKDDLKGFATKDDLKRFATKDDLKRFATKDDLKGFATKDDLKGCATKDDLKGFATKGDFLRLEARVISMQKTLEGLARHHALILDNHEVRIRDLERRR